MINDKKEIIIKEVMDQCINDIEYTTKQFKSNKINYKEFCLVLQNSLNLIKYYKEI